MREKAESVMLSKCFTLCCDKAKLTPSQLGFLFAGDLLNQCVGSTFAARDLPVPFFGVYGACSTMAESLSLAAMVIDAGYADAACAMTSSHFCSAERQFRLPLEYGGQRAPTAQWTVTGAGAVILRRDGPGPYVTHLTTGRIRDAGITDVSNMGAAMAPAAYETLKAHFEDTGRGPDYYDAILTGDLGKVGHDLLTDLFLHDGVDLGVCSTDWLGLRVQRLGARRPCAAADDPGRLAAGAVRRHRRIDVRDILPAGREYSRDLPRGGTGDGGVRMIPWLDYIKAFLVGGALCALGQVLIDRTALTPARILTSYVVAGVVLGALGVYAPLAEWAGAGATVPLTGFGNALARGVKDAVETSGVLGAFTGGFTAAAGGIAAAVFFGYLAAVLFRPREKR